MWVFEKAKKVRLPLQGMGQGIPLDERGVANLVVLAIV
jgi:hypothetical protein